MRSFSHGMMADVGSAFPGSDSEATGINTSGVVAGTMTDQFGTLAFVSPAIGNVTFLFPINNTVPLAPTRAAAINDSGEVCGDALFWSSPGSPMVIAGYADARDINASGVMVGIQDSVRARIWTQNICGKGSTATSVAMTSPSPIHQRATLEATKRSRSTITAASSETSHSRLACRAP